MICTFSPKNKKFINSTPYTLYDFITFFIFGLKDDFPAPLLIQSWKIGTNDFPYTFKLACPCLYLVWAAISELNSILKLVIWPTVGGRVKSKMCRYRLAHQIWWTFRVENRIQKKIHVPPFSRPPPGGVSYLEKIFWKNLRLENFM